MSRLLMRLTPILALLLVLAMAGAASAQTNPAPGAPVPVAPAREVCVPVGLALAVLSPDGTVADILPAPVREPQSGGTPGNAAARTIVLPGPAAVGSCGDFQGFWGTGAAGTEAADLILYQVDPTAGAPQATLREVARDSLKEQRRGPAVFNRALRALTKLEQPGTYHFVAAFSVAAVPVVPEGTAPAGVTDALRVPFTVEIREPEPLGAIEGTVYDTQGKPLQGVVVMAMPPALQTVRPLAADTVLGVVPNAVPAVALPAENSAGVVIAGAGAAVPAQARLGEAAGRAVTDEQGNYRITVPAGKYVVGTTARSFAPQFYNGKVTFAEADRVAVQIGVPTTGIDFALTPVEVPVTPDPGPLGIISGRVTKDDGTAPIAGAVVMAVTPDSAIRPGSNPGAPLPGETRGIATRTGRDGTYELKVPVGKWFVIAKAEGYQAQWFEKAPGFDAATVVEVMPDTPRSGVDFALLAADPNPVPPVQPAPSSAISGAVTTVAADGVSQPVPAATIIVAQRIDSRDPSQPPQMKVIARGVTARDGTYIVKLQPGAYVVGLVLRSTSAGSLNTIWWDGQKELKDAAVIKLSDGDVKEGIDFVQPGS